MRGRPSSRSPRYHLSSARDNQHANLRAVANSLRRDDGEGVRPLIELSLPLPFLGVKQTSRLRLREVLIDQPVERSLSRSCSPLRRVLRFRSSLPHAPPKESAVSVGSRDA